MAAPQRQGTMQATVEEGREFLKHEGADHLLPDVQDEDDGDHPPAPGRQGTMQVTAAEGIEYLKAAGEEKLLEMQGLLPTNGNGHGNGATKRKHGDDENGDEDEDFVEGDENGDENGEETNGNGIPHVEKHGTMQATAKEGEELLEWMGGAPDPSARTRAQQRELDEEKDEPDAKKPKVTRDTTIEQTTKEANALLENEVLGETRSKTAAMKEAEGEEDDEVDEDDEGDEDEEEDEDGVPTPKKTHTMKATTEEARHFVPDPEAVGETRSATAAIEEAEKESKNGH